MTAEINFTITCTFPQGSPKAVHSLKISEKIKSPTREATLGWWVSFGHSSHALLKPPCLWKVPGGHGMHVNEWRKWPALQWKINFSLVLGSGDRPRGLLTLPAKLAIVIFLPKTSTPLWNKRQESEHMWVLKPNDGMNRPPTWTRPFWSSEDDSSQLDSNLNSHSAKKK